MVHVFNYLESTIQNNAVQCRGEEKSAGRVEWVVCKLSSRRKRGRPQRRVIDVVKQDIQRVGVTEVDGRDMVRWGQIRWCPARTSSIPKMKKKKKQLGMHDP